VSGTRTYVRGLTECLGCGRLTRPSTALANAFNVPTIKRYGGGLCLPCYKAGQPQIEQPSDAAVREAFEAFIRARRKRGIPEEGLRIAS
jgi:hypothetical protein